ncbi:MAG: hypothetical protein HZC54_05110 [Verrucomicrobia bacterium]|nr:hypothetical protein [Verrucomicrobiota bacterium]
MPENLPRSDDRLSRWLDQFLSAATDNATALGLAPPARVGGRASSTAQWKLVMEATMFVTNETVLVWSGAKTGGNDPAGIYTRLAGLVPLASLTLEAV